MENNSPSKESLDQIKKGQLVAKETSTPFDEVMKQFPEIGQRMEMKQVRNKELLKSVKEEYEFIFDMLKKRKDVDPDYTAPKDLLNRMDVLQQQSVNILNGVSDSVDNKKVGKVKLGTGANAPEVFEDQFNEALNDPQMARELVNQLEDPAQKNEATDYLAGIMGDSFVKAEPGTPQPAVPQQDPSQVGNGGNPLINSIKSFLQERGFGGKNAQDKVSEMSSAFKSGVNKSGGLNG